MKTVSVTLLVVMGVGLVAGQGLARAQVNGPLIPQGADTGSHGFERDSNVEPSMTHDMLQRQLKKLRLQHQHEVITDTDRMVQLATAMKDEVDQGNKSLNADMLRDADELSKLAKRVSERIKTQ